MRYFAHPDSGLSFREVNQVVEEAFSAHARGRTEMPPKVYVNLPGGDFRTMPAYLPDMGVAGVKVVNVHPGNPSLGLPTVMALIVILDPQTGTPLAVLNGTTLTDMRTGAAGAVAVRHLARGKEVTVGLVGGGRQASAQIRAIAAEVTVTRVRVWSRNPANAERFCRSHREFPCSPAPLPEVCDADVIVTTTPATSPVVRDEWVHEGTHINAIGADAAGKQELDPAILARARIFVDDPRQAVHSGEVNVPISHGLLSPGDIAGTIGEVVNGKTGRRSPNEITVFDSTGLSIQDLAIARLAMERGEFIELSFG